MAEPVAKMLAAERDPRFSNGPSMCAGNPGDPVPDPQQVAPFSASSLLALNAEEPDPQFWIAAGQGLASVWAVHVPFAHWIVGATHPRILVELGPAESLSYATFCQAVEQLALGTRCFAVTGPEDGAGAAWAGQAVARFDDASIDLLHLDGLSTYEAVEHSFEAWLPKLSERAVVLLDGDAGQRGDAGGRRFWDEVSARYPSFEFMHGQGLGVLAVGRAVPAAIGELCELRDAGQIATVRHHLSLLGEHWAARVREFALQRGLEEQAAHVVALERQLEEQARQAHQLQLQLDQQIERAIAAERTSVEVARRRAEVARRLKRSQQTPATLDSNLPLPEQRSLEKQSNLMDSKKQRLGRSPSGHDTGRESVGRALRKRLKKAWRSLTASSLGKPHQTLVDGPAVPAPPTATLTVHDSLARQFGALEPFRISTDSRSGPRISIVTDSVNPGQLYGGVGTAILFGTLLANRIGADLRLVTRFHEADPSQVSSILMTFGIRFEQNMECIFLPPGSRSQLPVTQRDLFLTTSWWTTAATKRAVGARKIVYLLQEDERMFYPRGDERLRCAEMLASQDLQFVINSELLFRHLGQGEEPLANLAQHGCWFEPAFPFAHYHDDPESRKNRSKKNFLFYARPNNLRNLYWRGIEAISTAIQEGILSPDMWNFIFVGRDLQNIELPHGVRPTLFENMPWSEYADLIRKIDLGMSLIDTPHPSYPPLDLAASGAVVVTNTCGVKTSLANYSENIICAKPTIAGLSGGLREAVAIVANEPLRAANFARNKIKRDWAETLEHAIGRCTELVDR